MTDSLNRVALDLAGAKPRVEVDGVLGVLPKIYVDGVKTAPIHGGWAIDLKKGERGLLRKKAGLPGFQTFLWQGEPVYKLGAHVQLPEKIAMFAPAALIVLIPVLMPVALMLFFMNISVAKNPHMPRVLRVLLPVLNTVAVYIGFYAVLALFR